MKKTLLTLTLLCVALTVYSLDYRQVIFGNSYRNIVQIDTNAFFTEYNVEKIDGGFYRVYEQKIGGRTFYRLLSMQEDYTDEMLLDWKNISFKQILFEKIRSRTLQQYYLDGPLDGSFNEHNVSGTEIITRNNRVIGFLDFNTYNRDESRTIAYFSIPNRETYYIEASKPLIDEKRPLMYSIQNAFDGNPSTSFVEDTSNNLMYIEIVGGSLFRPNSTNKIMIINGYALGDYYYQNNQVKTLAVERRDGEQFRGSDAGIFTLSDTLKPQVMDITGRTYSYTIKVVDVVNGTKFTDTAIAEFDMYIPNEGWIFGYLGSQAITPKSIDTAVSFIVKDDNTAEITDFYSTVPNLVIPETATSNGKTYTITSVSKNANSPRWGLESVTIPKSINSIFTSSFVKRGLNTGGGSSIRFPHFNVYKNSGGHDLVRADRLEHTVIE